jgi:predicted AAA+ superfamily ATPase
MLDAYTHHNLFKNDTEEFFQRDPHLRALAQLKYQYISTGWVPLMLSTPGIYILTGGRQIGKSTACKLAIKECLQTKQFTSEEIFYLPCDEIYDAKELSGIVRNFLDTISNDKFLLIIDEVTFVKNWDRVIKALADEGYFQHGICLLTGSDTLILKEAAMRFPGRRGMAAQTDFHLYPLSFADYVQLRSPKRDISNVQLAAFFQDYLVTGGYLRAINDYAETGKISEATFLTYEQWIRGDFLKQGKNEDYLLAILGALFTIGVSQISYSKLTQKIGLLSKETCIDYMRLLERMDILMQLQAFDQNKKQGFPRKDRKFHFCDPFIRRTIYHWLSREGYLNTEDLESNLVEATVASHCRRLGKTFYFKGDGEIDVVWHKNTIYQAIEVKWSQQLRPNDFKTLKQFKHRLILGKTPAEGVIDGTLSMPVYQFLNELA